MGAVYLTSLLEYIDGREEETRGELRDTARDHIRHPGGHLHLHFLVLVRRRLRCGMTRTLARGSGGGGGRGRELLGETERGEVDGIPGKGSYHIISGGLGLERYRMWGGRKRCRVLGLVGFGVGSTRLGWMWVRVWVWVTRLGCGLGLQG